MSGGQKVLVQSWEHGVHALCSPHKDAANLVLRSSP